MRVMVVMGTRPEVIKLAPVVRALRAEVRSRADQSHAIERLPQPIHGDARRQGIGR